MGRVFIFLVPLYVVKMTFITCVLKNFYYLCTIYRMCAGVSRARDET